MLVVPWWDMKRRWFMSSKWLLIASCGLVLASCGSMTVQGRIEANPAAFSALSPSQQAEVKAGRISVGMPESAVYMALGAPSGRAERVTQQGQREQLWIYTTLTPVAVWPSYFPYYGYGAIAPPQWVYQSEPAARIVFRNGKVVCWEQAMP